MADTDAMDAQSAAVIQMTAASIEDFRVTYSTTDDATCRGCHDKIVRGNICVKKVVYDTEVALKFGGQLLWFHMECFEKLRIELGWFLDGHRLPGLYDLFQEDRDKIINRIQ